MATPAQYGIPITPAEETAILAAIQTIRAILLTKVNFNMTNEEKQAFSTMQENRLPYVLKSISDYAVQYPHLNGLAVPVASANIDLSTYGTTGVITTGLKQLSELTQEIQIVAGHFAYKFMLQQYNNAEENLGENVEGAQVVYDGLKGCFEGQGPQNPATPPQP